MRAPTPRAAGGKTSTYGGFPKIRDTFLGVPIIMTLVFWGPLGSPYLGKLAHIIRFLYWPLQSDLGLKSLQASEGSWVSEQSLEIGYSGFPVSGLHVKGLEDCVCLDVHLPSVYPLLGTIYPNLQVQGGSWMMVIGSEFWGVGVTLKNVLGIRLGTLCARLRGGLEV